MNWRFASCDQFAAQNARKQFVDILGVRGGALGRYDDAEIVFGELVGNATRYAPGRVRVWLEWPAEDPILHVFDYGPAFSINTICPDEWSESGRGLLIVAALTRCLSVARLDGCNQVTAVLSLTDPADQPLAAA